MKFNSMKDIIEFCEVLDQCKDAVWMQNVSGAYYDLKSELSRYVAISEFLKNPNCDLELFASNKEDEARLMNFIVEHARHAA